MRCDNCQNEPPKAARYCDCCGHPLNLHADDTKPLPLPTEHAVASDTRKPPVDAEAARTIKRERSTAGQAVAPPVAAPAASHAGSAAEMAPADDADDWAPNPGGPRQLRCPSCNGPSLDGNQCAACYELAAAAAIRPPAQESCDDAAIEAVESAIKIDAAAARRSARDMMSAEDKLASARATAAETVRRAQEKAQRPPVVTPRSTIVVAPKKRRYHPIELAAASLVVAALGAGAVWDRIHVRPAAGHQPSTTKAAAPAAPTQTTETVSRPPTPVERPVAQTPVKPEPVAPVAKAPVVANRAPARPSTPSKVAQNPGPAVKPVTKTPTPSQPKAAQTGPARKPAPVVVNKAAAAPAPASVEKSAAPVLASAPVVAAPVVVAAEPAPKPAAQPAAAVGPFFEPSEVNETPRITGGASPNLPASLKSRSIHEVVIVRALVSQTGQASRISLLRRSKAGPELDDVVLAAVHQWTFSPAKKKGEPVSCWFNFAVPVASDE